VLYFQNLVYLCNINTTQTIHYAILQDNIHDKSDIQPTIGYPILCKQQRAIFHTISPTKLQHPNLI
ncbi:MAG: hypothetical protein IKP73_12290, partial [Bacteroidales bacterium]|nr:hypothetical protein [Bacteroidales bacterium]